MKKRSCVEALTSPVDRELCHNFRGVRQRVMCRAWQMEDEGVLFAEAISRAWDEVIRECRAIGASPSEAEKPTKVKTALLIDRESGQQAGKIILADSELTVCFGQDCTTTYGDKRLYYVAQAFFDRLGYNVKEV